MEQKSVIIPLRHTLMTVPQAEKSSILATISLPQRQAIEKLWDAFPSVPLIYTRQPGLPGSETDVVSGGLSFPVRQNGVRVRAQANLRLSAAASLVTPWQIAQAPWDSDSPHARCLQQLKAEAERLCLSLGAFGSTALQIFTGYPYLSPQSDLDIILRAHSWDSVLEFRKVIARLEAEYQLRIDPELMFGANEYAKLKEVAGTGSSALVKSETDVYLLSIRQIQNTLDLNR